MSDDAPTPDPLRKPAVARRTARPVRPQFPEEEADEFLDDLTPRPPVAVLFWFRVLCVLVCLTAVVLVGVGVVAAGNATRYGSSPLGGGLFAFLAGLLFVAYSMPLWVHTARPWVWWYGLALLALALVSLYFTVFAAPLLAFWLTAEVRTHFHHEPNTVSEAGS